MLRGPLFEPPRRMVVLFIVMTLVPSMGLLAAGWRLLQQEQAALLRQLTDRREQAADLAVSELERVIGTTAGSLASPAAIDTVLAGQEDSVRVTFGPDGVHAFPLDGSAPIRRPTRASRRPLTDSPRASGWSIGSRPNDDDLLASADGLFAELDRRES